MHLGSLPLPVATRSKAWVCGQSFGGITGSNPTGGHGCLSFASVVCCKVGRGLCVGLITRPDESYRVWYVQCLWSWSLDNGRHTSLGVVAQWKKVRIITLNLFLSHSHINLRGSTDRPTTSVSFCSKITTRLRSWLARKGSEVLLTESQDSSGKSKESDWQ